MKMKAIDGKTIKMEKQSVIENSTEISTASLSHNLRTD